MLRCTCPAQLLHITLNHLEALRRIVADGAVAELVDAAIRQCVEIYARLPVAELFALQATLARFFQDRRVKVSLFLQARRGAESARGRRARRRVHCRLLALPHPHHLLQDGIQRMDGTIVLDLTGPLPPGTEPPGIVRYFDARGGKAGADKLPASECPVAGKDGWLCP